MLKQQMRMCITCCIFKSVGAFQASFYLKEKVLLLKLKNKIFIFFTCSQSECRNLGKSKLAKKAGNTHISQDGGKSWEFPANTENCFEIP